MLFRARAESFFILHKMQLRREEKKSWNLVFYISSSSKLYLKNHTKNKLFFLPLTFFFKELLSFRKFRKAHVEAVVDDSPQTKINKIKSDSCITTKTYTSEHIFIETEFLPLRKRSFQVNMVLMSRAECGMCWMFYHFFLAFP